MRQGQTNLRVNDKVEVIAGKDKGRVGKVLRVERDKNRVVVERINMVKKHQKATDATQSGQIIEREAGIHISNVMRLFVSVSRSLMTAPKFAFAKSAKLPSNQLNDGILAYGVKNGHIKRTIRFRD